MMAGSRALPRPTMFSVPRPRIARLRGLTAWLLLAPSLLFLLLFTYWAVVQVVIGSFSVQGFRGATHFGLDNYARLFSDAHFRSAALNTAIYAVGTIVPSVGLALGFA